MSPTDGSEMNVIDYVKAGQYIQAIKQHREETGLGLKESKEYVDKLRTNLSFKMLKSKDIDEMKQHISETFTVGKDQREFLLDLVEEAYFLGEDSGEQTGYHKALSENHYDDSDGREEMVAEEAYDEGWSEGRQEGLNEGYESGYEEGREEGYDSGYEEGKMYGYDSGYEKGRAERNE